MLRTRTKAANRVLFVLLILAVLVKSGLALLFFSRLQFRDYPWRSASVSNVRT